MAADEDESRRELGINALARLADRPDVTKADRLRIEAALEGPLASLEAAWNASADGG